MLQFGSVPQSCLTLQPNGPQHARPPCPSPTPRAYSNSCPLSRWCHPTISSSVISFSSCLQSCPASGSFPVSQFFTSDGQSIGVSALVSVLPVNIQDWFPWGLTGLISLQSKWFSGAFSNTTVQKHQFMRQGAQSCCTGMTLRGGMGREVGRGFRIGNICTSMADSCQCMAKTITIL